MEAREPFKVVQEIESSLANTAQASITMFLVGAPDFMFEATIKTSELIISKFTSGSEETAIEVDEDGISQNMAQDLFAAIWNSSACDSCEQEATDKEYKKRFHPARLYLGRPRHIGNTKSIFDAFVSLPSLRHWQEIGFVSRQKQVTFAAGAQTRPSPKVQITGFCKMLRTEINARVLLEVGDQGLLKHEDVFALHHEAIPGLGIPLLHVLEQYQLDTPEKIMLSHAIAREFWQLYETKMMLAKWSSSNIWFMPNSNDPNALLPCKPYISFPFDYAQYDLEEHSSNGLIHKYPRIFSLAILLLEISLGRPIQTSQLNKQEIYFAGHMNKDFFTASKLFTELKDQSWGEYTGKHIFDEAINACMTHLNFTSDLQTQPAECLSERRHALYEKVVKPLQWLAGSFSDGAVACLKRRTTFESQHIFINPRSVQIDELCPSTFASFYSGRIVAPEKWLDDLKRIGRYIHHLKHQNAKLNEVRPIRVAILDSGCSLAAPYFQDGSGARANCIKAYKDFVDQSDDKKDSFGHGTFMATLVIEAAPNAELYVARVAENTAELDGSEATIGQVKAPPFTFISTIDASDIDNDKAIMWAGIQHQVDIVSMSFGVRDSNNDIKSAILNVRAQRGGNIIFLASAGNSGPHQDTAFPASLRDVISIRSTNYMGTSSETNPACDAGHPVPSFATFGDNIPGQLLEYRPDVCGPGSSVSTAVAAAIAASILSYCACLQIMHPSHLGDQQLNKLRTVEGIEELFRTLSTDMGNRTRFINPVKFFSHRPTNFDRLCALVDCINKIG